VELRHDDAPFDAFDGTAVPVAVVVGRGFDEPDDLAAVGVE
jgi:hypothetical protein